MGTGGEACQLFLQPHLEPPSPSSANLRLVLGTDWSWELVLGTDSLVTNYIIYCLHVPGG